MLQTQEHEGAVEADVATEDEAPAKIDLIDVDADNAGHHTHEHDGVPCGHDHSQDHSKHREYTAPMRIAMLAAMSMGLSSGIVPGFAPRLERQGTPLTQEQLDAENAAGEERQRKAQEKRDRRARKNMANGKA